MMTKLSENLNDLREHMVPDWTEARSQAVLDQIHRRKAQSKRQRIALSGLAMAGAVATAVFVLQGPNAGVRPSAATSGSNAATSKAVAVATTHYAAAKTLLLADQSTVEVSAGSDLAVRENTPKRVAIDLPRGGANFDVVPDASRSFIVRAGEISVSVLGTMFQVRHRDSGILVAVRHGRVQVTHGNRVHFVSTGEGVLFAKDGSAMPTVVARQTSESRADVSTEDTLIHGKSRKLSNRPANVGPSWRALAKAGEYEAAYDKLQAHRASVDMNDPSILLDAADGARFSGHPTEAVRFLDELMSRYRQGPMAPLAAFTLGRVCLEQLGQPQRAADAFALAYALSPQGSLAQDALAREVEALSKGGRDQEAFERAQVYLQRYPEGRRLRAVRMYGGLP